MLTNNKFKEFFQKNVSSVIITEKRGTAVLLHYSACLRIRSIFMLIIKSTVSKAVIAIEDQRS